MTWVWLKVGAKYDKCKDLLQKVRVIKYEALAYVTIFNVYLTNYATDSNGHALRLCSRSFSKTF